MNFHELLELGVSPEYLEHLFLTERYVWLALSFDMAVVMDIDGCMEEVNAHWERVTGHTPDELRGNYLIEFMRFEDRERVLAQIQGLITADIATKTVDFMFLCKDGTHKRLFWSLAFSPEHNQFFCVVKDVTDPVHTLRAAYHDSLTGLPNRLYLTDYLPRILSRADQDGKQVAVLFIDLDGFKQVNDTLGHRHGDALLVQVGQRMKKVLSSRDVAARLGGDEFVCLLFAPAGTPEVEHICAELLKALNEPFLLSGQKAHIGCSIGVALYPDHGREGETLLDMADQAMYRVKRSGKNRFLFTEGPLTAPPGQE